MSFNYLFFLIQLIFINFLGSSLDKICKFRFQDWKSKKYNNTALLLCSSGKGYYRINRVQQEMCQMLGELNIISIIVGTLTDRGHRRESL